MSQSCDKLMQGAFVNNSFSIQSVNRSLKMEYENSFPYLLRLQKSMVRFNNFVMCPVNYTDKDQSFLRSFYLDKRLWVSIDITHDILDIKQREEYFHSDFFEKELSPEDIYRNRKIFKRIPILIIDGMVYHHAWYKYTNGMTEIHIEDIPKSFLVIQGTNTLIPHDVQVMVIDNWKHVDYVFNPADGNAFYALSSYSIGVSTDDGSVFLCYYSYRDDGQARGSMPYFIEQKNKKVTVMLNSIDAANMNKSTVTDVVLHAFYLPNAKYWKWGSGVTETEPAYYNTQNINARAGEHRTETTVIGICDKNGKPYPHPIPVENMILLRKRETSDAWYPVQAKPWTIEHHYPNLYRVIDHEMRAGDQYRLVYFYEDPFKKMPLNRDPLEMGEYLISSTNKMRPMFQFFYDYLKRHCGTDDLTTAVNMVIKREVLFPASLENDTSSVIQLSPMDKLFNSFWKVYTYDWQKYDIPIDVTDYTYNYHLGLYQEPEKGKLKEPFEYKVGQMWKFVHSDEEVLHRYVIEQNIVGESYYMYENVMDVTDRYCVDTGDLLEDEFIEFDEPMYRFEFQAMSKGRTPMYARVFVDGLYMHKAVHKTAGPIDYIFVPVSAFTKDCIFEIEVYPEFEYFKQFHLDDMTTDVEVELEYEIDVQPTLADFFVTMEEADQKVFADEFWAIHQILGDLTIPVTGDITDGPIKDGDPGEDYINPPTDKVDENYYVQRTKEFAPLKKFKISAGVEELFNYGNDFQVHFMKKAHTITLTVTEEGCPQIELPWGLLKPEKEYIRIFKNGRLVNHNNYYLAYKARPLFILFYTECAVGDIITIDILPYKYTEVFYKKAIDIHNPLTDLSNDISNPFDNRYYDVYLNGRKMSWNACFAMSPWLLTLVNIKSSKHLQVFSIERDKEYFGLNYRSTDRPYSRGDLFEEDYITPDEIRDLVKDKIEEDKDPELIIHPNTDEEDPIEGPEQGYISQMWTYYYGELIPTGFVDPNINQVVGDKIGSMYPIIKDNYFFADDAMMIDPNQLIRGQDETTTQAFLYGANEYIIE